MSDVFCIVNTSFNPFKTLEKSARETTAYLVNQS